jgi:hypothetical protein
MASAAVESGTSRRRDGTERSGKKRFSGAEGVVASRAGSARSDVDAGHNHRAARMHEDGIRNRAFFLDRPDAAIKVCARAVYSLATI